MLKAGIDIGSRTIKLVLLEDEEILRQQVVLNTYDPVAVCKQLLDGLAYDSLVATGYGRHLFENYWDCHTITEIKAVSIGCRNIFKDCRTILDIGGQDTKAISLDKNGKIKKFEMNDRCAAGTGKFLEIVSTALGFSMEDFIANAQKAEKAVKINSMCTVFAESEIISLVSRGTSRENLAAGLHESIVTKCISMLDRVGISDPIAFCGGVAHNSYIKSLLETKLSKQILIAENPQIVAAYGCALCAE